MDIAIVFPLITCFWLISEIMPFWVVQLYTHRDDVDAINACHLADLEGQAVEFKAQDEGSPDLLHSSCPV